MMQEGDSLPSEGVRKMSKSVDIRPTCDLALSYQIAEDLKEQGIIRKEVPVSEAMMSVLAIIRRCTYATVEYREKGGE
ncbi:hypothetical protein CCP3SC15_1240005 [Gammaproteobacteria bacterium]